MNGITWAKIKYIQKIPGSLKLPGIVLCKQELNFNSFASDILSLYMLSVLCHVPFITKIISNGSNLDTPICSR